MAVRGLARGPAATEGLTVASDFARDYMRLSVATGNLVQGPAIVERLARVRRAPHATL